MVDKLNDFLSEPLPRKVLYFDEMLAPNLIRALYWLGLVAVFWSGLGHFFSNGFFGLFEAVVFVIVGAIGLRIGAELLVLLFRICERLDKEAGTGEFLSENSMRSKKR
jgi:uncharacterized membrane protein SpoIIM required for sporulation